MATSLVPIAAGVLTRSLWTILLFGCLFSMAYVLKRRRIWRPLLAEGLSVRLIAKGLATLCVQIIIVAVLYGIGYVLDVMVGDSDAFQPLGATDLALGLCIVASMAIEATYGDSSQGDRA